MFVVGNRQISYAHITVVEFLPGLVDAKHPKTGAAVKMFGFNVHTSYNHVETILFETDSQRKTEWAKLIDSMERVGY